jgi:uncharacterized membrane protein YedE/YeeE
MRRFGDFLIGFGLVVGIGAVVGYESGLIPNLPPAVLKLVIYKLAFIGALGLFAAGALMRRLASQTSEPDAAKAGPTETTPDTAVLTEGRPLSTEITPQTQVDLERLHREP